MLFFRRYRLFALWKKLPADAADGTLASSGGAMLAPVKNDLQVELIPALLRKESLEIVFGLDNRTSVG